MFATLLADAWRDHGDDPSAVAARLPDVLAAATEAGHLSQLAGLAVHVCAEHLGDWGAGQAHLDAIAAHASFASDAEAGLAVARGRAVLVCCAEGLTAAMADLDAATDPAWPEASTRVRILTVAASALAGLGRIDEASPLLEAAITAASYGPHANDPAARSLAITGNNLAAALEERADRDPAATALMKRAAHLGRTWWAVAGTWSNVVLAEVRLAYTYLAAGEADMAALHARAALDEALAHDAGPDDRLAPRVALAKVHRALGDDDAGAAVLAAQQALAEASEEMQGWYRDEVVALS